MSASSARSFVAIASLVLLVIIVLGGIVYPPARWVPAAQWGELLQRSGASGLLIFATSAIVATAVGLPRQMVAFIAGLAYGTMQGLLVSLIAALIGCYLTMRFSKIFLSRWVAARFPRVVTTLDRLMARDVFLKVLILRLQPLGTNLLTNVCAGFTRVSQSTFLAASAVGYIPQMLVFTMLGAGVRVGSTAQISISILLLGVSLVLAGYLYRKYVGESGE